MLQRRKLNVLVENQGHRICKKKKMECDCPFIFYMCLHIKYEPDLFQTGMLREMD
jgi:hypothetical protein